MFSILILLLYAVAANAGAHIVRRADVNGDTVPGKWIVQLAQNAVLDNGLIQELNTSYGIKVDTKSSFDLGMKGDITRYQDPMLTVRRSAERLHCQGKRYHDKTLISAWQLGHHPASHGHEHCRDITTTYSRSDEWYMGTKSYIAAAMDVH